MNSTMCTALLTLLSMTLFAGNSVLCRLALLEYKMEPVTYTAVRLISGALMLWLIMAVRHKNVFKSGTWPGALSLFTYMACFSWAYVELPTAVGTLIIAVAVQTTMIGFGFFSGERPSRQQGIGIGIATGKATEAISRQPEASGKIQTNLLLGAALADHFYIRCGMGRLLPVRQRRERSRRIDRRKLHEGRSLHPAHDALPAFAGEFR